jgi:hypothetical protein
MTSFIIALLIAGAAAFSVHEFTWVLRRRALTLMCVLGVLLIFALFVFAAWFLLGALFVSAWGADPNDSERDLFLFKVIGIELIVIAVLIAFSGLLGRLHMTEIPSPFWKAALSASAEIGLAIFVYFFMRGHWGGGFMTGYFEALQYNWVTHAFDYYDWNWWFERLFVVFWMLLAATRPIHKKVANEILQMKPDWFRLK